MATQPIKLQGMQRTLRAFNALPPKLQKQVMPKAARAGGQVFVKAARVESPKRNRLLSRSLTLVVRRYKTSAWAVIGQQNFKKIKPTKRKRRSGGISGRGLVVPVHLVETEVKPHAIPERAASGRVMAYKRNGQTHFARRIKHPGHRGSGFIRRAAASAEAAALRKSETKMVIELARTELKK